MKRWFDGILLKIRFKLPSAGVTMYLSLNFEKQVRYYFKIIIFYFIKLSCFTTFNQFFYPFFRILSSDFLHKLSKSVLGDIINNLQLMRTVIDSCE